MITGREHLFLKGIVSDATGKRTLGPIDLGLSALSPVSLSYDDSQVDCRTFAFRSMSVRRRHEQKRGGYRE